MGLYLCFFTIILYQLKIIQVVEFANYDLLFYLKKPEIVDERITIVKWDEKSINALQESVISDNNLNKLITKILQSNPRVIGLDLYRDLPVSSVKLSQKENLKAFNSLNQTFKNNSNIIGIKKIVIPKIQPPPALEAEGRAAAADISLDKDVRVRKVYIFPNVDEDGTPTEVPYIGVALGYNYLAREGWMADNIPHGLKLHKNNKSVILKPLSAKLNSNNLYSGDSNWKLFLNWRKSKLNNNFNSISAVDIINTSSDLNSWFRDRLVVIGNVTGYSGDVHRTPIDRWQKKPSLSSNNWQEEQLTNGVEIVAQVASSIVNKAINNRNLIYPVPLWIIYFSIFIPLLSLSKVSEDSFDSNLSLNNLRWKILVHCISYIMSLAIACYISFNFFGIWFSATPGIISIILGCLVYTYFSHAEKEKRNFHYLKLLMKDFKHNIRGVSRQIASANRAIQRNNSAILTKIEDNIFIFEDLENELLDPFRQNIHSITTRNKAIDLGIRRINTYQERTTNFLRYTYSSSIHHIESCDLNYKIEEITNQFIASYTTEYTYNIETEYDESIITQKLYIDDWIIVVENLLSNAIYAINPELNRIKKNKPKIKIQTINTHKYIQLIVEDNGIGIPTEIQQKIFFPFVSFKEGRGDGMGLHLVSQIINCRQGRLMLDSNVNKGTKFIISLPKIH